MTLFTMKYVFIFAFLISGIRGNAQITQTTDQNKTGNWNSPGNWTNSVGDNLNESVTIKQNKTSTVVNGDDFTIGALTLEKAELIINAGGSVTVGSASQPGFFQNTNNATLIINGDLIIYGSFIVQNGLSLTIGGNLIIKGDIEVKNNAVFSVTGDMVVEGDFDARENAEFYIDGSIDVGGDVTVDDVDELEFGPDGSFTVGGTCTGPAFFCAALPVDLVSFSALPSETAVAVRWSTASEVNNDYFTLQVSRDGVEYRDLTKIAGAGMSETLKNYSFVDTAPLSGKSYYRLTQTDFDGKTTVYIPVRVDRSQLQQPLMFPNPVDRGDRLTVFTGGTDADAVEVSIVSLQGKRMFSRIYTGVQHEIEISRDLAPGVYILQLSSGVLRESHRLVVR